MPTLDAPRGIALQPRGRTTDDSRGQPHEGRRADAPDAAGKIEIGNHVLQIRAVRRMDEVGAPGWPVLAKGGLDLVKGRADLGRRKPARPEETHHSRARHGDHHARGGDPARHLAHHVRETHAMGFAE